MKIILSIIILFCGQFMAQSQVYNISIQSLDGKTINMADYKGKKIIVASVSPDNLQRGQLLFLDSLQLSNPLVVVIIVPGTDFGGMNDSLELEGIKRITSLHLTVAAAQGVKKVNGGNQNRLMRWLTNATSNTHFDADVQSDNQMYMISESGILYAVLQNYPSSGLIDRLIKQPDVKQ